MKKLETLGGQSGKILSDFIQWSSEHGRYS